MLSRIFWVGLAGIALVAGMLLQHGDGLVWFDGHDATATKDRAIEARIDRAVDRSVDHMQVVGSDGEEVEVSPEMKRALARAVGELVKAEANLAVLKIRDVSSEELQAATAHRDQARAQVDNLKAAIEKQEQASGPRRDQLGKEVDIQVRDEVRSAIRRATHN